MLLTFCKVFERKVSYINPKDNNEPKETVNCAAIELIFFNIKKRGNLCVEQKSDHFEHLLKLKDHVNEE